MFACGILISDPSLAMLRCLLKFNPSSGQNQLCFSHEFASASHRRHSNGSRCDLDTWIRKRFKALLLGGVLDIAFQHIRKPNAHNIRMWNLNEGSTLSHVMHAACSNPIPLSAKTNPVFHMNPPPLCIGDIRMI